MRVAALQLDVVSGQVDENLTLVETGLHEAAAAGVQLVALPEMWPTSFLASAVLEPAVYDKTQWALDLVRRLSRELDLVIVGSAYGPCEPASPAGPEAELPANRLHVFDRGQLALTYDKVHLFSPTAETEGFRAGTRPPSAVDSSVGRISGVVCYDLRFPELTRVPFHEKTELLVVPAQWPSTRATHWRSLCIGRAVENQCFVLGANRTGRDLIGRRQLALEFPGNSIVVAPSGEVLAEGDGQAGLVVADVDLADARTMQRRVPVAKDQRPELYRSWDRARSDDA